MEVNWVSVKQKLPRWERELPSGYCNSELVLILLPENSITTARYIRDSIGEEYWLNDIGDFRYPANLVTHWHELPMPLEVIYN